MADDSNRLDWIAEPTYVNAVKRVNGLLEEEHRCHRIVQLVALLATCGDGVGRP